MDALTLIHKINTVILNPIISIMFAVALLVFVYGVFEFVRDSASEDGRETGKRHIIYGLIGLFIMVSAFGIIKVITGTFGLSDGQAAVNQIQR